VSSAKLGGGGIQADRQHEQDLAQEFVDFLILQPLHQWHSVHLGEFGIRNRQRVLEDTFGVAAERLLQGRVDIAEERTDRRGQRRGGNGVLRQG
jgi:hypothetical protein